MDATTSGADASRPRIPPGDARAIGRVNAGIGRVLGLAAGGRTPNILATLARHRRLFRPWLRFAGALMPGGDLPRAESELVILRVAHNCGSAYEWSHHERLGVAAGLTPEEVERVREGAGAPGWSRRQQLLLRAADELHEDRMIGDGLWGELSTVYSEAELIEICMLTGHYEMLAMTLNSLRVQPDPEPIGPSPRLARVIGRRRRRGRRN